VVSNDYADMKEGDEAAAPMPECASQKLVLCLVQIMQHLHECDEYPSQVATGKTKQNPYSQEEWVFHGQKFIQGHLCFQCL
jgi:hypothetical protein